MRTSMSHLPLHQASPSELKARLDVERRGAPFLLYFDDAGRQQIVVLESRGDGRVVVGRGTGIDVGMDWDGDVSRVHAELERLGGCWTIADDGLSRNGTFLNGERVRGRRRLVHLDRLRFGTTIVIYMSPNARRGGTTSVGVEPSGAKISSAQRRVLVALARPYAVGGSFATPASNADIAAELSLTVVTVKMHLRALGQKFAITELPQNRKRARLVELAFQSGEITERDLQ